MVVAIAISMATWIYFKEIGKKMSLPEKILQKEPTCLAAILNDDNICARSVFLGTLKTLKSLYHLLKK